MEVPKNFKDLQKVGVRNIAQYNAAYVPFLAFIHRHSLLPHYPPCLQERLAKLSLALVSRSNVDCETSVSESNRKVAKVKHWAPVITNYRIIIVVRSM